MRRSFFFGFSVAVMVLVLFFHQGLGFNPKSRLLSVFAVVEDHTLVADRFRKSDMDYAVIHGHTYSDKAPLSSFLVMPFYWVMRQLEGGPFEVADEERANHIGLVVASAAPFVAFALLLFGRLRREGLTPSDAVWMTMIGAFGTCLSDYGATYFGHMLAAALFLLSYVLACEREERFFLAGICGGAAVLTEYPLALTQVAIYGYLLLGPDRWRRAFWYGLGALPCAILMVVYNKVATGGFLDFPYHHVPEMWAEMRTAFGLRLPSPDAAWELAMGQYRGMAFYAAPMMLAVPMICTAFAGPRRRQSLVLGLLISYFLLISSYFKWDGGWCLGPRHLAPVITLGIYEGTAAVARAHRFRPLFIVLSIFGGGISLIGTATESMSGEDNRAPAWDVYFPKLHRGEITGHNLFNDLDLPSGRYLLLVWLVLFIGLTWLLAWWAAREAAAPGLAAGLSPAPVVPLGGASDAAAPSLTAARDATASGMSFSPGAGSAAPLLHPSDVIPAPALALAPAPAAGPSSPYPWLKRATTAVMVAGALPRIWAALCDQGMFWPDEVYQSLEPAHRFAFHYAVLPWEFREGARSWLFPGLLGLYWKLIALLGVHHSYGLVSWAKLLMVAVSMAGIEVGRRMAARIGGPIAGLVAALLLCACPLLVFFGPRVMTETVSGPFLLLAIYLAVVAEEPRPALAGVFAAAAVFFRYQNGLVLVALLGLLLLRKQRPAALRFAVAAAVVGAAGGLLDAITWRYPFQPFLVNLKFNMGDALTNPNLGREPVMFYFKYLWSSLGVCSLLLAVGIAAAGRRAAALVALTAFYFGIHLLIPHKELRFLLPIFPLAVTLAGVGLWDLCQLATADWKLPLGIASAAALVMAAQTAGLKMLDLGERGAPGEPLWHAGEDYYLTMRKAEEKPDLCGIALVGTDREWTGGYTYLHRRVPIYFDLDHLDATNYVVGGREEHLPDGWSKTDEVGSYALYRRDESCTRDPNYQAWLN